MSLIFKFGPYKTSIRTQCLQKSKAFRLNRIHNTKIIEVKDFRANRKQGKQKTHVKSIKMKFTYTQAYKSLSYRTFLILFTEIK